MFYQQLSPSSLRALSQAAISYRFLGFFSPCSGGERDFCPLGPPDVVDGSSTLPPRDRPSMQTEERSWLLWEGIQEIQLAGIRLRLTRRDCSFTSRGVTAGTDRTQTPIPLPDFSSGLSIS